MICINCEGEDFVLRSDQEIEQEFRGKIIIVKCPIMECNQCGFQSFGENQLEIFVTKFLEEIKKYETYFK